MKHVKPNALAAAVALSLMIPTAPVIAMSLTDDATATLQLRNLYFNRDLRDEGAQSKAEEWAQGFIFRGKTGYTHGEQGLGLDVFAALGVKLDSDDERAGTLLLPSRFGDEGPDHYSQIMFTAKAKVSDSELRVGGLIPTIPVAQASDIRLIPQTYTGASLDINEFGDLGIQLGQLRQVNYLNSSDFQDIGATVGGTSDRFNYIGGTYKVAPLNSTLGLWRAELENVYAQNLYNLVIAQPLGDWTVGANLAWFETSDDGTQSLSIDHTMKSLLLSAGTGAHVFRLGYQHSDGDTAFPYLSQNNPYLANYVQILDFARPDEQSWQARYDLDFASLGLPGLKGLVRYVKGTDIDLATTDDGSEWERDIDFTYTIQSGPLKNLAVQWRNAMVRSDAIRDINENRLILNYTITLR